MNRASSVRCGWPDWWRLVIIATSTLVLCSCRAAQPPCPAPELPHPGLPHGGGYGAMMPAAGMMPAGACLTDGCPPMSVDSCCMPPPIGDQACCGPCYNYAPARRPGWGEYVCDGGDRGLGVDIAPDWQVYGLDAEDTVVHYDTLSGETKVVASNCVCIYAPRFGAVRSVARVVANETIASAGATVRPEKAVRVDDLQIPASSLQRVPPQGHVAAVPPTAYIGRLGEHVTSNNLPPVALQDGLLPFANLEMMRSGVMLNSERARLMIGVDAAITWTHDLGVQVVIENTPALVVTGDRKAQATFSVEPMGKPCLRICKVASTNVAQPGDVVDFTLRIDNLGTQPAGNVVVMDNLTTRLEYVPDSAQSSLEANFSTQFNEHNSLVLRWEFVEPIPAGQGGLVRFQCRVR